MTLALACIAGQFVALVLGAAGKMQTAERMALEAAEAQLEAARVQAQTPPAPHRPQQSGTLVAAPAAPAKDIDTTLRPRNLQQILADEAGSDGSDAPPAASTTVEFASARENEARVEAEADEANREEFERLVKTARASMIEGDIRKCVLCLEQASTIYPDHPALLYFYGMAYEKLLNVDKAREYYTKIFTMREKAGPFFQKAVTRLKNGFETPMDMRGKMSFGPVQTRHTYDPADGERVVLTIPVLLAPGQEMRPEDLTVCIQFYDIVNGQNIAFTRSEEPVRRWVRENADWADGEELLEVTYHMPVLTNEELAAYGELKYYGFTAKLFYKGEPLDCVSAPSALILTEQILQGRPILGAPESELLPADSTLFASDPSL